jgi:ribosome-associated protein
VQLWDVLAAEATGRTDPRVLFSTPEARMVMIDLVAGERLGDHEVHERAIIQVARGSIELTSERGATTCGQGAVVLLEPGERHAVRAPPPTGRDRAAAALGVRDIAVSGEFIGLGQLLQLAGVADTGGEAKVLISTLTVSVNGEPEGRRGRKLRPGDVVDVPGGESLRVVAG